MTLTDADLAQVTALTKVAIDLATTSAISYREALWLVAESVGLLNDRAALARVKALAAVWDEASSDVEDETTADIYRAHAAILLAAIESASGE